MSMLNDTLESKVVVPKVLLLLTNDYHITHEAPDVYRVVESKDIPNGTPIIFGSSSYFFHEKLVSHLMNSNARISKVQRIKLWRKLDGFRANNYFTLTVENQISYREICIPEFQPQAINTVSDSGAIFFSRKYFQRLEIDTQLQLSEGSLFHLVPLG